MKIATQHRVVPGALVAVAMSLTAQAETVLQPLPNGDFSADLAGWTVEVSPLSASPPGVVFVNNGEATLEKGGAFYVGLQQSFIAPEGLQALQLTVAQPPVFSSAGDFIPEAFDIHIIRTNGSRVSAGWRPGASASANAGPLVAGFGLGNGVTMVGDALRIPLTASEPGEILTVVVSLTGASANVSGSAAIDDILLEIDEVVTPPPPVTVSGCALFIDGYEETKASSAAFRCALGQVGDTGITECSGGGDGSCPAAGFEGQDAEFGRDALAASGLLNKIGAGPAGFDYTKLDPDGHALPDDAPAWSCVVDAHTGLMWEVKVDDPGDPSHFAHTYSWYEADMSRNGGSVGVVDGGSCTGSDCDIQGQADAINAMNLCGGNNWRIPTREEMLGLINAGESQPAVVTEYFPLTGGNYWSATPVAPDSASAWLVDFTDGSVGIQLKAATLHVRLVREVQ